MDFAKMMQMMGQVKEQLETAQKRLEALRVTGEAGAGLVRVEMNGRYEVLSVHIDPVAVNPDEKGLLEDMIQAAFSQAATKVGEVSKEQFGGMAGNMGIDPSIFESLGFK